MKLPLLYLASQSARRRDLLKQMRVRFRVVPSHYRERMWRSMAPEILVMRHAAGKARKAVLPDAARLVLGADTLVYYRRPFGKPKSWKQAVAMIQALSGTTHTVYTGVTLRDPKRGWSLTRYAKTRVTFKKMKLPEIEHYLRQINPFDKAGAYAIQGGPRIVRSYQGSYSNVIGLPRELLRTMLREWREACHSRGF